MPSFKVFWVFPSLWWGFKMNQKFIELPVPSSFSHSQHTTSELMSLQVNTQRISSMSVFIACHFGAHWMLQKMAAAWAGSLWGLSQHIPWTSIKEEEPGRLGSALLVQLFPVTALTQEGETHSGIDSIVMYLTSPISAGQMTSCNEGVLLPFPLF